MNILCFGQSFEGKIIYQNTWKSKIPNVTDEQFATMMGKVQDYVIKDGNYKNATNGSFLLWQIYINKDNKLYAKTSGSPAIYYNDATINTDEVLKAEINKGITEILGFKCDELVLTCKTGIQKFYFSASAKLKIDASLFANHKYGNWYDIISRTNSIPLKMVIYNPQFVVESVAIEIIPQKVDEALFTLPADAKIERSPY
jgi:hypothetical protein